MTLLQDLEARLATALASTIGEPSSAAVTPAADLRFGDYQTNAAMVLAKQRKTNPRALAQEIIGRLDLTDLATAEIAGPGFINFRVLPQAYANKAQALLRDAKLGVPSIGEGQTVVVDFSAPNVAKPMHVGHIRSTIIGDSLCRIARFLGFKVIADNHIGDWGTQFGMIIHGWKNHLDEKALAADPITELVRVYRDVNTATKADPAVLDSCKAELVKLQAGDAENLAIWHKCIELSKFGLEKIYDSLDVRFDHWLGESYYNDRLAGLVDDFLTKGIARESNGAVCIFSDGTKKQEDDPFMVHKEEGWTDNPAIIRKADGGFLYATTDLATLQFRIDEWQADQIWYVVGVPQQLHFRQIFDAAARWGKTGDFKHVAFGSILGEDRKLMKTRSGDNVQLTDVLTESVERAAAIIAEKSPDLQGVEANEEVRAGETLEGDRRKEPGPARRGSRENFRNRRHRCREIRRALAKPPHRLRLRLGPHARLAGRHRALPAILDRAHPLDFPQTRRAFRCHGMRNSSQRGTGDPPRAAPRALRRTAAGGAR